MDTITGTTGVHGIAVADELGLGFSSNGRSCNATIIDTKLGKAIGTVAAGRTR